MNQSRVIRGDRLSVNGRKLVTIMKHMLLTGHAHDSWGQTLPPGGGEEVRREPVDVWVRGLPD